MFNSANGLANLFSIQNIIIYVVIINLITFLVMYIDKRKAKKGSFRISEKALFILALIGGSIGGIIGMYKFRHKTKKKIFTIGFPAILIFQIIAIIVYSL